MDDPSVEQIRDELERLMLEQIESLRKQTFLGVTPQELEQEKERLKRIREVSAEFLKTLKRIEP